MHGFSFVLSLISAFVPVPPGSVEATPPPPPPPAVAQVEPAPQPAPYQPAPYQPAPITPAPTYAPAPPPPMITTGGNAPALKGPTVWGILGYGAYGGFGLGARFALPIYGSVLRHPTWKDGFAFEFGGDFLHGSETYGLGYDYSWTVIRIAGGVMWDIWVNDQFAFYPKLELGYNHWSYSFDNGAIGGYSPGNGAVFFNGAGGILYRMQGGLTLRAEAGYAGLAGGVGWLF